MMNADPIHTIICQIDQADEIRERCRMAPDTPRHLSMRTDYPPLPRRARIGPVWLGIGIGVLGLLAAVAVVYALILVIGTGYALDLPPALGGPGGGR